MGRLKAIITVAFAIVVIAAFAMFLGKSDRDAVHEDAADASRGPHSGDASQAGQSAGPPVDYELAGDEPVALVNFARVKVFYATDRLRTASQNPADIYGVRRDILSYGVCEVGIPRDHRMGELERPVVWRLEFREDPKKHVVLLSVEQQTKENFFRSIGERIKASSGSNAFVFVHGFNTSFAEAARRTAQMSYDLGFNGAPVFYSWPSQGTSSGYPVDETNVEWTQAHLKAFLEEFAKTTRAENIYLIAHSLGNRALTGALKDLYGENAQFRGRFREVILAAPDIDADVFKRDIAPQIVTVNPTVTLYASSQDEALKVSKRFHGYARAGDSYEGLVLEPGIETIDSTDVKSSFLGHSYFAESNSIIADIFTLINSRKRADQRPGLRAIKAQGSMYWKIEPAAR